MLSFPVEFLYSFAVENLYSFPMEFLCPFPVELVYSFAMEFLCSFPVEFLYPFAVENLCSFCVESENEKCGFKADCYPLRGISVLFSYGIFVLFCVE